MPSIPIPIENPRRASHPGGPITPPQLHPGMSSNSPSSSISISPQTPFFPHGTTHPKAGTSEPLTASSPTSAGFFKWAAASLGRSPPATDAQRGFDIPNPGHGLAPRKPEEHDHENHDSFEFGDFDDLKSRSWNQRRAVSMSGPSGISAMLAGFASTSPPVGATTHGNVREAAPSAGGGANGPGAMPMSLPSGGVLADNAARGHGVLRRLSMSGTNFVRVSAFRVMTG